MIDYSVYMQVSHFSEDGTEKAYAKPQVREVWDFDKFVQHIADHNGVFSRGTVKGVIADMCECLVEQLLNGNKVYLGELGTFSISLSSEGADSMKEFTAAKIKAVNIIFTPGDDFDNLVGRATFNPVASRVAQAATLKAEKAGETTVDLAAAKATAKGDTDEDSTDGKDGGSAVPPGSSGD